MSKRYRERIEEVELCGEASQDTPPTGFRWRGRRYRVVSVLGHWHEDARWWRRTDGVPEHIERTDLWRVEAGALDGGLAAPSPGGVYELVRRGETWRLDRVWD
jgi:hypothetical protein